MNKVTIYLGNILSCSWHESYYCTFVFVNIVSVYLRARSDFVSTVSDEHHFLIFFILMDFEMIRGKWITAVTAKMQFGQRGCSAFIL